MRESGKVVKNDGAYAVVRIDKKEECSKCGMCLFSQNASFTDMRAENKVGAAKGDTVLIEKGEDCKLLSLVLVFLIPLILIGIAAAIATLLIKKEVWVLFLSLIFIALWYAVLAFIDKKLRKKENFTIKIIEILSLANEENKEESVV